MQTVRLKPKEHHRITAGHLWIYKDELVTAPSGVPGELVSVETFDGIPLGNGFYNPLSKIAVRMLGEPTETADTDFFTRRFEQALRLRERMLLGEEAFRLIFGESDLLSGLIIDVYGNYAVMQMLAAGMDIRKQHIVDALKHVLPNLEGIVERNTSQTRKKEGLELVDGVVFGEVPQRVRFTENGITLEVDLLAGQKTGYFLDQRINRQTVGALSKGKSVLDCFCNVGGFALNAAKGGATRSVGIDSSSSAVEAARKNAELNQLDACTFIEANVFDELRSYVASEQRWDIIILDPPSFAKNRGAVQGARAGYAELNRTAMKLLTPGGLLVSSSCTQLVAEHELMDIIYREAARLRLRLRLVHRAGQAPDHPILLSMPETSYLKFLIFDVIGET